MPNIYGYLQRQSEEIFAGTLISKERNTKIKLFRKNGSIQEYDVYMGNCWIGEAKEKRGLVSGGKYLEIHVMAPDICSTPVIYTSKRNVPISKPEHFVLEAQN